MLSALFSDPEKLQSAISMASSLLGGGMEDGASNSGSDTSIPAMGGGTPPGGGFSSVSSSDYDPSSELMSRAMPVINAIMSGGQHAANREKIHLLNAIKPFVADDVGKQLDHAMRLVSMARMARTVMGQFGGAKSKGTER